ncbi:MAG: hypothetical protein N4A48_00285 [Tepidibacter sp.]|uniref:hypothetical protein n=1 Tax=Tepidibacter sp. TaxID=2529387 RepID=UPI0025E80835|nr:hypothetical protein [Tepidibacter sp.]MCT4507198.1 hypothetical protein [Tepidibacter sp.]
MRKLIFILSILIGINCFMLFPKSYNTLIDKSIVDNYLNSSEDEPKNEVLRKQIIKNVLNATGYNNWNEYIDYIDLKIYKLNALPNDKQDILFNLNLSKDNALIAIYEDTMKDKYFYKNKITNLSPVKNIASFKNFLVVEQLLDERLGAFFIDNFVEVFYFDKNTFKNTFKKSIYYDEIYKDIWLDKNAPNDIWNKNIQKTSIDYLDEDIPKILAVTTNIKAKAKSVSTPKKEDFKEISKTSQQELYTWDENEKIFKLTEKKQLNEQKSEF